MERIVQEDATGCGLACVAMVAGVAYAEVRGLVIESFGFDQRGPFYTDVPDLRAMLGAYGYVLSRRVKFKSYDRTGPLCILGLERGGSGEEDHWALLVRHGLDIYVLDPARHVKTPRRRDWNRLRVVSYMNISRA